MFVEDDDAVLDYLMDEGQSIEPSWYCPVIPMVRGTVMDAFLFCRIKARSADLVDTILFKVLHGGQTICPEGLRPLRPTHDTAPSKGYMGNRGVIGDPAHRPKTIHDMNL